MFFGRKVDPMDGETRDTPSVQNVSASDAPIAISSTSRRPSPFTPTAMVTATETMRPACRTFS
jgi:hypothetical protein